MRAFARCRSGRRSRARARHPRQRPEPPVPAVASSRHRSGSGELIALGQIGHRRLLPHGFQRDLCLQCRVDLASRLRRHHPLRLSNGAAPSNYAHGPKIGGPFHPAPLAITAVAV
jgi:hypothetical protein